MSSAAPIFTNHLAHETSPYLLQHAHNPVDWYPWGKAALGRAKAENKPILVSIGYSACHWCHVMERESFEDEETAQLMNEHFINIKIDREERPDLDHIYMDALQAMTGAGGWPLNMFLTPDGKPFYGGTYFPPVPAHGRPSWKELLTDVALAFRERRHEVDAQAENLYTHLVQSNTTALRNRGTNDLLTAEKLDELATALLKQADRTWGGFGKAPKFPQTGSIQFLLRYAHSRPQLPDAPVSLCNEALQQALLSLDRMIEGGIYDQLGGGFARYSTDTEWLAPHFEKMLYDNALLVAVIAEAFQLTGKQRYREVIAETIGFVQRELLHPSNGFYAALDADSEGVEGKFYTWSFEEIKQLLGEDADVFCAWYDVKAGGNWEHTNILRVKGVGTMEEMKDGEKELLERARKKLFEARSRRIRPGLDDKIILGWNALMNIACSKAFAATGEDEYRTLAIDNMRFLLTAFREKGSNQFKHTWKNDEARYPAFIDDYACLVQALIQLQEITGDTEWLLTAKELAETIIESFGSGEKEDHYFYYTSKAQEDILLRKRDLYDGAMPSGNAVMAINLLQLGWLLEKPEWRERGERMVTELGEAVVKYPTSFGYWAGVLQELVTGTKEIVLVGTSFEASLKELLAFYLPHRVLMAATGAHPDFPLLADKESGDRPAFYLCRNNTCLPPVFSAKALWEQAGGGSGAN